MTENSMRFKYTCVRALLHMPISKRRYISHEIEIFLALVGSHFLWGKRHHTNLHYAENQSILFHIDPRGRP